MRHRRGQAEPAEAWRLAELRWFPHLSVRAVVGRDSRVVSRSMLFAVNITLPCCYFPANIPPGPFGRPSFRLRSLRVRSRRHRQGYRSDLTT